MSGGALRWVLGDQCSASLSSLSDLDPATDVVVMAEVLSECTYVKHHAKKIVLVLSAMRHFARALTARGVRVDYIRLDDPANTQTLRTELQRAVERHRPDRVVVTEAGEWRLMEDMRGWHEAVDLEVDIRDDTRFLCRHREFRAWARGTGKLAKVSLRMEFFYREMRRRYALLMDGDQPEGAAGTTTPRTASACPPACAPRRRPASHPTRSRRR